MVALGFVKPGEIAKALGVDGMILSQRLRLDGEDLSKKGLRFRVFLLSEVQRREIAEAGRIRGMMLAKRRPPDFERLSK